MSISQEELNYFLHLKLGLDPKFGEMSERWTASPNGPPPPIDPDNPGVVVGALPVFPVVGALAGQVAVDLHRAAGRPGVVVERRGSPTPVLPVVYRVRSDPSGDRQETEIVAYFHPSGASPASAAESLALAMTEHATEAGYQVDSQGTRIRVVPTSHAIANVSWEADAPVIVSTQDSYLLVIAGSLTVDDVVGVDIDSTTVSYTVGSGDTDETVRAGLYNEILGLNLVGYIVTNDASLGGLLFVAKDADRPPLTLTNLLFLTASVPSVNYVFTLLAEPPQHLPVEVTFTGYGIAGADVSTPVLASDSASSILARVAEQLNESDTPFAIESYDSYLLLRHTDYGAPDGAVAVTGSALVGSTSTTHVFSITGTVSEFDIYTISVTGGPTLAVYNADAEDSEADVLAALAAQLIAAAATMKLELNVIVSGSHLVLEPYLTPTSPLFFAASTTLTLTPRLNYKIYGSPTLPAYVGVGPLGHLYVLAVDKTVISHIAVSTDTEDDVLSALAVRVRASIPDVHAEVYPEGLVLSPREAGARFVLVDEEPGLVRVRVTGTASGRYTVAVGSTTVVFDNEYGEIDADDVANALRQRLTEAISDVAFEVNDDTIVLRSLSEEPLPAVLVGGQLVVEVTGEPTPTIPLRYGLQLGPVRVGFDYGTPKRLDNGALSLRLSLLRTAEKRGFSLLDLLEESEREEESTPSHRLYLSQGLEGTAEATQVRARIWAVSENATQWRMLRDIDEFVATQNTVTRVDLAGISALYVEVIDTDGVVRASVAPCR